MFDKDSAHRAAVVLSALSRTHLLGTRPDAAWLEPMSVAALVYIQAGSESASRSRLHVQVEPEIAKVSPAASTPHLPCLIFTTTLSGHD